MNDAQHDARRAARRARVTRDGTVATSALGAAEIALAASSLALVFGFSRVFQDRSFFWRTAVLTLLSHAVAVGVRRLGRGIVVSALASFAALAIGGTLVLYRDTANLLLPGWATRDAARLDLEGAWKLFTDTRTPVPVHPGFVLGTCVAMWIVAFLADWAAFRLWSPFEALAPGAVVFVFCSLEAADHDRLSSTFVYAATALAFVLLHRAMRAERGASWLAAEPARGRQALVRNGAVVALAAVLVGGLVGPALPGSDSDGAIAWRRFGKGSKEDQSRVTVSPLVTIKSRLVSQADVEAFRVQAAEPDYWRLTALDLFDGRNWTSSGEYENARGELPSTLPAGTTTRTLTQTITLEALDPPWMPAAFEPLAVTTDGGTKAIYEAESGTLTIGNKLATGDGKTYVVESRIPVRDLAVLNAATDAAVPAEIRARYTVAPPGLTAFVRNRATTIVRSAGATTPFQKALALQNWFRSGIFTYSLDVSLDQSVTSIDQFLQKRVGYCEQFASAFAAMARHLGLPARVAVGFTPGEQDENGIWRVRGEFAHAWPEVYLAGAGWVRFEPTPGRGAPGDQAYTGVPFQQATSGDPTTATTAVPTTTAAPSTTDPTTTDPTDPAEGLDPGLVEQGTAGGGGLAAGSKSALRVAAGIVLAVAAMLVLALAAVPGAKRVRRALRRRRLRASPRGEVAAAWEDALDSLALLGVDLDDSATPQEIARRSARHLPDAARAPLTALAAHTTAARYAPGDPDPASVAAAAEDASVIRRSVRAHVSRSRRIRRMLDPRPLVPRARISS